MHTIFWTCVHMSNLCTCLCTCVQVCKHVYTHVYRSVHTQLTCSNSVNSVILVSSVDSVAEPTWSNPAHSVNSCRLGSTQPTSSVHPTRLTNSVQSFDSVDSGWLRSSQVDSVKLRPTRSTQVGSDDQLGSTELTWTTQMTLSTQWRQSTQLT